VLDTQMDDETTSERTPLKTTGGIPAILVRKVSALPAILLAFSQMICIVMHVIE